MLGGSCESGFLTKALVRGDAAPEVVRRFTIMAVVLMSPAFILYSMHNKGNANRGGATVGIVSFQLANNLIEIVTARVRLLGYAVHGADYATTPETKWKFFHDFARSRIPLYMVKHWWTKGPCFFGEC